MKIHIELEEKDINTEAEEEIKEALKAAEKVAWKLPVKYEEKVIYFSSGEKIVLCAGRHDDEIAVKVCSRIDRTVLYETIELPEKTPDQVKGFLACVKAVLEEGLSKVKEFAP